MDCLASSRREGLQPQPRRMVGTGTLAVAVAVVAVVEGAVIALKPEGHNSK